MPISTQISKQIIGAFVGVIVASSSPVAAQDRKEALTAPPTLYTDMIACKAITDPIQRLACFDEKVSALETAQNNNEVVIADREQVREARKGLFGLSLPRIKLFNGDGDEGGNVDQIESTIASVRKLRGGKWLIKLEDGALWQQTSVARSTSRSPQAGNSIVIERGSLGSFVAKVNDGRAFKVKRIVN